MKPLKLYYIFCLLIDFAYININIDIVTMNHIFIEILKSLSTNLSTTINSTINSKILF